jgi:hypothetical protein
VGLDLELAIGVQVGLDRGLGLLALEEDGGAALFRCFGCRGSPFKILVGLGSSSNQPSDPLSRLSRS